MSARLAGVTVGVTGRLSRLPAVAVAAATASASATATAATVVAARHETGEEIVRVGHGRGFLEFGEHVLRGVRWGVGQFGGGHPCLTVDLHVQAEVRGIRRLLFCLPIQGGVGVLVRTSHLRLSRDTISAKGEKREMITQMRSNLLLFTVII